YNQPSFQGWSALPTIQHQPFISDPKETNKKPGRLSNIVCYICEEKGHIASNYPYKKAGLSFRKPESKQEKEGVGDRTSGYGKNPFERVVNYWNRVIKPPALVRVPEEKLQLVRSELILLKGSNWISARNLVSIAGKIQSFARAFLPAQ
ncbi:17170_t:CDS:2, partial [Racocetra persica]